MPAGWRPTSDRLSQLIAEEEARIEVLNQQKAMTLSPVETTQPLSPQGVSLLQPNEQQHSFMPEEQRR